MLHNNDAEKKTNNEHVDGNVIRNIVVAKLNISHFVVSLQVRRVEIKEGNKTSPERTEYGVRGDFKTTKIRERKVSKDGNVKKRRRRATDEVKDPREHLLHSE